MAEIPIISKSYTRPLYEKDQNTVTLDESEACILLYNFLLFSVAACENPKLTQGYTKRCWKISLLSNLKRKFDSWLINQEKKHCFPLLPLTSFQFTWSTLGFDNTLYLTFHYSLIIFHILFFMFLSSKFGFPIDLEIVVIKVFKPPSANTMLDIQ